MNNLFRYLFLILITISAVTMPNFIVAILVYSVGYLVYAIWSLKVLNEKDKNINY